MIFFVAQVEACWSYSPVYYTGGRSRWRISPEQGMFYCHQHTRDISAAFSIRLHFSYVWMTKIPWSQGKEKEKQVSALSPSLILIAPGTVQLQINDLFLADYSSHSSQYLALLWSVGYGNTKTRNSNSFISFTNFSSLKVVLFIFTLHLYFEGVLLKCIFLADNNLALCSHLPHLDPFSSEPSASFSHDCFLQWAHLLCHVIPFSQFSINHPCGKHVAGCNACCSPLVPQLLHFLPQILEVHLDLF